jgi:hypothetical protein
MVDKDRIRTALKEVNLFVGEVDRALDNIDDMELTEEEKSALEDIRRAGGLLEEAQEDIENDDLFSR